MAAFGGARWSALRKRAIGHRSPTVVPSRASQASHELPPNARRNRACPGRSLPRSEPHRPHDWNGDAALVPAGVAPSVADFRFCRLGRLLGALAFNERTRPASECGIGIALRQVRTSAFCESARLNPGGSSSRSLVQSPRSTRRRSPVGGARLGYDCDHVVAVDDAAACGAEEPRCGRRSWRRAPPQPDIGGQSLRAVDATFPIPNTDRLAFRPSEPLWSRPGRLAKLSGEPVCPGPRLGVRFRPSVQRARQRLCQRRSRPPGLADQQNWAGGGSSEVAGVLCDDHLIVRSGELHEHVVGKVVGAKLAWCRRVVPVLAEQLGYPGWQHRVDQEPHASRRWRSPATLSACASA